MSTNDPYRGRRHQSKLLKDSMRASTKPDSKSAPGRAGIGDVKDTHLTGKGSPYSDAHVPGKK